MSNVETAMCLLIESFSKFAGKEGNPDTLTKGELKELLQSELAAMLGNAQDKSAVDKVFETMDRNKDNSVDFNEFISMVCCLTMMCHEHFCKK